MQNRKNLFGIQESNQEDSGKYLYIMISKTSNRLSRLIRKFGKVHYSHAAISLHSNMKPLYAFARPRHHSVFLAGLIQEKYERYTYFAEGLPVPIMIFRIPVSPEAYDKVSESIELMENNPEYMYNLFSMLLFPVKKGFQTNRSFTCIEYAVYLLELAGYPLEKHYSKYTPDDLPEFLKDYIYYQGDIRDIEYEKDENWEPDYFKPISITLIKDSFVAVVRIMYRTIFKRK